MSAWPDGDGGPRQRASEMTGTTGSGYRSFIHESRTYGAGIPQETYDGTTVAGRCGFIFTVKITPNQARVMAASHISRGYGRHGVDLGGREVEQYPQRKATLDLETSLLCGLSQRTE